VRPLVGCCLDEKAPPSPPAAFTPAVVVRTVASVASISKLSATAIFSANLRCRPLPPTARSPLLQCRVRIPGPCAFGVGPNGEEGRGGGGGRAPRCTPSRRGTRALCARKAWKNAVGTSLTTMIPSAYWRTADE
jgi:hypothetical protein